MAAGGGRLENTGQDLLRVRDPGFVLKRATALQDLAETRARLDASCDQVTTPHDVGSRTRFDAMGGCLCEKAIPDGKFSSARFGDSAPEVIRSCESLEFCQAETRAESVLAVFAPAADDVGAGPSRLPLGI